MQTFTCYKCRKKTDGSPNEAVVSPVETHFLCNPCAIQQAAKAPAAELGPKGNTFNYANGPHGHTVTVTTPDGFTGQGYTAQDALSGALAQQEAAAKSYVVQPRLADPDALESGLTLAIDGSLLWANLSYIEACEWRQQIWDMKIDYTFQPPCIKVVSAIFPAEA